MNARDTEFPISDNDRSTSDMAWRSVSYLTAGILFYGGIGWLVGRYLGHQSAFIAAGVILGISLALYLTYARISYSTRDTTTNELRKPPQ
jgi:ATP synthase protein I